MASMPSVPIAQQLQAVFIDVRNVYEIRERESHMYSWTALITSQLIVEIPWDLLGSSIFFFCWYFTVGFPASRAGYSFLFFCVAFPLYYTTIGQAVAAMSSNAEIAALLLNMLVSLSLFCGFYVPLSRDLFDVVSPAAMAYCNPTVSLDGGNGCIESRLSPTLRKA